MTPKKTGGKKKKKKGLVKKDYVTLNKTIVKKNS